MAAEDDGDGDGNEVAVRFPYFSPLLHAIEAQLASGLPVEWWLGLGSGAAAAAAVDVAAVRAAEAALRTCAVGYRSSWSYTWRRTMRRAGTSLCGSSRSSSHEPTAVLRNQARK